VKLCDINCTGPVFFKTHCISGTMKTEDTEALGRQRAKANKMKARYSQLTCKNCSYLCAQL